MCVCVCVCVCVCARGCVAARAGNGNKGSANVSRQMSPVIHFLLCHRNSKNVEETGAQLRAGAVLELFCFAVCSPFLSPTSTPPGCSLSPPSPPAPPPTSLSHPFPSFWLLWLTHADAVVFNLIYIFYSAIITKVKGITVVVIEIKMPLPTF